MAHPAQHEDTVALSLRDLRAGYNGRTVLHGVDLDVPHGTFGAVVGPNGSGKSTLVKASLGLLTATRGSARFFGSPLVRVRSRVAYVPQQDSVAEDFPITAVQVVEMGRYPHRGWFRRLNADDDDAVAEAMEATGVQGLANTPLDELSGGQRQRVFLARALAQRADLLILDEPFTAVDARTEDDLLTLLERLCASGVTVLAVHHDLRTVRDRFAYAVLLSATVIAAGPVGDALSAGNLERAYGIAPLAQPTAAVRA